MISAMIARCAVHTIYLTEAENFDANILTEIPISADTSLAKRRTRSRATRLWDKYLFAIRYRRQVSGGVVRQSCVLK